MSHRKFLVSLGVILAAGIAFRAWNSALPDLPPAEHVSRGMDLQKQERYAEAIRHYTAAIAKEPRNWNALTQRGICRVATREIEASFADLDDAIRYSHGKAREAYLQRVYLYRVGGLYDEALADANRLIELDPKDPLAYAARSIVYSDPDKGDRGKARADYDKALSLAPPELKERILAEARKFPPL